MANEEAIRILEYRSNLLRKFQHIKEAESVEISKDELNTLALFADQYRKEANAIDLAIRALKGQPIGEPLTLEQLREMNGQPVWVKVIDTRFNEENQWAICNAEYQMVTLKDGFKLFFCGYGLNWLAYAYHPAHIDREAWKKCPWCKSEYTVIDDDFGQPVHPNMIKFCWNCGRPLTPEAWAELEKRLRGW